mmetsp:Transcript_449/g.1169  ORF Transcript_449/g.1169 Transcript_449/m.1169 type:complete len:271 (-) Transcript_449:149-961(-)
MGAPAVSLRPTGCHVTRTLHGKDRHIRTDHEVQHRASWRQRHHGGTVEEGAGRICQVGRLRAKPEPEARRQLRRIRVAQLQRHVCAPLVVHVCIEHHHPVARAARFGQGHVRLHCLALAHGNHHHLRLLRTLARWGRHDGKVLQHLIGERALCVNGIALCQLLYCPRRLLAIPCVQQQWRAGRAVRQRARQPHGLALLCMNVRAQQPPQQPVDADSEPVGTDHGAEHHLLEVCQRAHVLLLVHLPLVSSNLPCLRCHSLTRAKRRASAAT